ncbi:MAG: phosphate butyryltransferase [Candidatus Aegiribacteria sp.]|nr:phosphate butyryltransferase [Candidatus Aegiribacteria sp.]MBD3294547.1 phosphate butyryltransferase [Candidatus Fermentibacteria bacterium]
MYCSFDEIRNAARDVSDAKVAIPMGHDAASLKALISASKEGFASAVIAAPESRVRETLDEIGEELPSGIRLLNIEDPEEAALKAVELVSSGDATILMKGMLQTSVFLKAVLDKEVGLRTGRILSHVAVVHVPYLKRLVVITDGGMNISPEEDDLVQIIQNGAEVITALGADRARVALLAAKEVVTEKMPETLLYDRIVKRGISGMDLCGPVAVDGAIDPEAAEIKGMHGPVAGRANVLVTPNIACGNIFAKAFMYMTDAEVGGLIAGAAAPVVMLSRSDKSETKLNSLALGVVVSGGRNG